MSTPENQVPVPPSVPPITLNFTLVEAEANQILNALAQQPYAQVANLINKIQQQAQPQMLEAKKNNLE